LPVDYLYGLPGARDCVEEDEVCLEEEENGGDVDDAVFGIDEVGCLDYLLKRYPYNGSNPGSFLHPNTACGPVMDSVYANFPDNPNSTSSGFGNLPVGDYASTSSEKCFEVILQKQSSSDKFGLTLCYRPSDVQQDVTEVFISEYIGEGVVTSKEDHSGFNSKIEPGSVAHRSGQIMLGDRLLKIGDQEITSREHVMDLFQGCGLCAKITLTRQQHHWKQVPNRLPPSYSAPSYPDSTLDIGISNVAYAHLPDQDSGMGRTTDDSVRTEESSEQASSTVILLTMWNTDGYDLEACTGNIKSIAKLILKLLEVYGDCDEDGFYFGECNGRKGLVPSNMVCEASAEEVTEYLRRRGGSAGSGGRTERMNPSASSNLNSGPSLPPGQMTKPHRTSVQLHDQQHGQVDQSYHQQHRDHAGRASQTNRGKTRRNRTGRGDADHPRTPGGTSEMSRRKGGENQRSGQCIMEALYDYDPHIYSPNVDVETELKFRAGDRIVILSEMDEDGFYVGQLESSGRRGLVPSNFLRELPRSPHNGGGIESSFESHQKPVYGCRATLSRDQRDSRSRGASVTRSRLQSDDADIVAVAPSRGKFGRTREDLPRQLSRGHSHADELEDSDEEEEEDSMITSTVPPANPSDWVDSPDMKTPHTTVPVPSLSDSVPNTSALMPPTRIESDSIRGGSGRGKTDVEMGKESPDSDGQGGLIFMDINSNKHGKGIFDMLGESGYLLVSWSLWPKTCFFIPKIIVGLKEPDQPPPARLWEDRPIVVKVARYWLLWQLPIFSTGITMAIFHWLVRDWSPRFLKASAWFPWLLVPFELEILDEYRLRQEKSVSMVSLAFGPILNYTFRMNTRRLFALELFYRSM
uniref:PDZ domain-containing protein n=1 Tax=Rodentolepis nana TaxID=102285 RepID=A0A158QIH3_RODNA